MSRQITPRTSLENLKREAKRWLDALRDNVAEARARLVRAFPNAPEDPTLRDVQHALAREHGFAGWTALKNLLDYEIAAASLLDAYRTGNAESLQRVWDHAGHRRPLDGMRRYVRVDLGYRENDDVDISLDEARLLVARGYGFATWQALTEHVASQPAGKRAVASRPVGVFSVAPRAEPERHRDRRS